MLPGNLHLVEILWHTALRLANGREYQSCRIVPCSIMYVKIHIYWKILLLLLYLF